MANRGSIRERHICLIPYESADEINGFNVSKDTKRVTHQDFNGPRHLKIVIPLERQPAELRKSLEGNTVQIAWSVDKVITRYNVPFQVPIEPGTHVEATIGSDWDSLGSILTSIDLAFVKNQIVTTDDWQSWYSAERFQLESSRLFAELGIPQEVSSADSITIQYGKLPRHSLPHRSITDLILEAYWDSWTGPVDVSARKGTKVEVGLLSVDPKSLDADHLVVSGAIRELGEHKKWQRTLIDYGRTTMAATGSSFRPSFEQPVGLHPKHALNMVNLRAPHDICQLYAKYTIPKTLFLDKYQLADLSTSKPNKPAAGELIAVWGETDLEAPVWSVPGWGSEAIVRIHVPPQERQFTFTLPMHSRYEAPRNYSDKFDAQLPVPDVFWACQDLEGLATSEIPSVGYKSLFPHDTIFYHIESSESVLHTNFQIPVAPASSFDSVQAFTSATILLGFLYVTLKIWKAVAVSSAKAKVE